MVLSICITLQATVPVWGFPGGVTDKDTPPHPRQGDARDVDLSPGSERSPGGGHGNPVQYSCLENPVGKRAWQVIVHGVIKSQTQLRTQEEV